MQKTSQRTQEARSLFIFPTHILVVACPSTHTCAPPLTALVFTIFRSTAPASPSPPRNSSLPSHTTAPTDSLDSIFHKLLQWPCP